MDICWFPPQDLFLPLLCPKEICDGLEGFPLTPAGGVGLDIDHLPRSCLCDSGGESPVT